MENHSRAPEGEYQTTDLYFAAYLQVAGAPMKHTNVAKGRLTFVFDSTVANIVELQNAWFNHSGKVSALPYANAVKSLKHICHVMLKSDR